MLVSSAEPWIALNLTLEGTGVRLEPLHQTHLEPLWKVSQDPELWRWIPEPITSRDQLALRLESAAELRQRGIAFPFAIFDKCSGSYVGSSSYLNVDRVNRRLEIGYTWVASPWQGTHVNTEAKYLLLRHAFEVLHCVRVEFKTDSLNSKSRAALGRIGATEEGCLRKHMLVHGVRFRDSIYFSILDSEWPRVSGDLASKLSRHSWNTVWPRLPDSGQRVLL